MVMMNLIKNWDLDFLEVVLKEVQKCLMIEPTGIYDDQTKAALRNYQLRTKVPVSGLIDQPTFDSLRNRFPSIDDTWNNAIKTQQKGEEQMNDDYTTDLSEVTGNFVIHDFMLPNDEYVNEKTSKKYIFIHHTAGWNNPYNVVDSWAKDDRGRIGTHYVIGGINVKTGDSKFDGEIVKCIPDEYWANHLGGYQTHGIDPVMHKQAVGIEICNFGYVTRRNDGQFYTYTGQVVDRKYVADLGFSFRGYQYWHKYTDAQIASLNYLIGMLSDQYKININLGLQERIESIGVKEAFNTYDDAKAGRVKGLLSHTSVRKDKTDVSPQINLVKMIQSL